MENFQNTPDLADNEQWFDCDTHSPVDLKKGYSTPPHKRRSLVCPPAPHCRKLEIRIPIVKTSESDDRVNNLNESGICPLDISLETTTEETNESPVMKKFKREDELDVSMSGTRPSTESFYSELCYLEAIGTIAIQRQSGSSDEQEKRECKMLVSYRVHKDDPADIQIALIIYKPNSQNPKTRRNLMEEFETESADGLQTPPSSLPTKPRCQTVARDMLKDIACTKQVSTAPADARKSKATKRPLGAQTSLRF